MSDAEEIIAWLRGRIPEDKLGYTEPPEITIDRDEILIIGRIPEPEAPEGGSEAEVEAARSGRIAQHREDTRAQRMRVADDAERRFRRKVSWGARCGDHEEVFTNVSLPVMTRLRMRDRQVLDALVDAGVARSRSHALAWCVSLVGKNQAEWIADLKDALRHVEKAREAGPR